MRRCPFKGCLKVIGSEYFACKSHWFLLSKEQADAVRYAYRQWKEGNRSISWLRDFQSKIILEVEGEK
jgi:hypothetical protein